MFVKIYTVLRISHGGDLCTWSMCLYLEIEDDFVVQNKRKEVDSLDLYALEGFPFVLSMDLL